MSNGQLEISEYVDVWAYEFLCLRNRAVILAKFPF